MTSRVSLFELDKAFFADVELAAFVDDAAHVHTLQRSASSSTVLRASTDALLSSSLRSSSESESSIVAESAPVCRTCGSVQFASLALFRSHCGSEWHRLNLKLKLAGVNALPEAEFLRLQLSEHDGSDNSGDSDASDSDDTAQIAAELTAAAAVEDEADVGAASAAKTRTVVVAFDTVDGKRISLNKSLLRFASHDPIEQTVLRFRSLRAEPLRVGVLLISGGRFAGGLFVDAQCTHHKAVSRYVVRAKQGGSQAFHDSKGRAAKSVGASLRRHNAVRLQEDIVETLQSWRAELARCHLILLSAPGDNRRLFVRPASAPKGDDSPLFARTDARVRSIAPLVVQRPTFSEVQRVHFHICSLELEDISKPADDQPDAPRVRTAAAASAPKSTAQQPHPLLAAVRARSVAAIRALFADESARGEPYLATASDNERRRWEREALETPPIYVAQLQLRKDATSATDRAVFDELLQLVTRGRLAVDAPIGAARFRTPLHVALQNGNLEQALALLRVGADPTRRDSRRALPIDIAARGVVDPLRRFAFENAELCAWADAGIVPLSPEIERAEAAQREAAAKERAEAAEAAAAKAAAVAAQQEAAAAAQEAAAEVRERAIKERRAIVKRVRAQMSAISDREKRAVAAERRISGTPSCARCSKPVPVVSFDWEKLQFCTERCFVEAHQQATKVHD